MIGHESRRPAAKPRLGSGVPRASSSAGVKSACPWPASTRAATVPPVRNPWLGLGQALTRSATRRRGLTQGRGSAPGRTRAVSACSTRATRLALSRQRALTPGAQQGQLDLAACDRLGARRVGQARRGGTGLPSDAPGRSRRAQRARRALLEAGSVPCCAPLRRASSISPPAIGSERDASAGRYGAVRACGAGPSRVVEALRPRRARAVQAAHAPGAAPPLMARWHEPAGSDERSARPSIVHGACTPPERGRCVAHRRSEGTMSPRARSRRPRARAAGMFERGDKQCI